MALIFLLLFLLIALMGLGVLLVTLAKSIHKVIQSPKDKKIWARLGQLTFLCLVLLMFVAPNEVRLKIAEARLWPLLKEGRTLDSVTTGLQRRLIRYSLQNSVTCFGADPDLNKCGDIRKIYIRLPIYLSLIDGGTHIEIYFDKSDRLKYYEMKTHWTFI